MSTGSCAGLSRDSRLSEATAFDDSEQGLTAGGHETELGDIQLFSVTGPDRASTSQTDIQYVVRRRIPGV
jgi:hypothetical protein